jgi:hypothetical protein
MPRTSRRLARWARSRAVQQVLSLSPWTPVPFRSVMARLAARKGLAAAGLAAAPEDPSVIISAGLWVSAARHDDPFCRVVGHAGLGDMDASRATASQLELTRTQRWTLAAVVAPHDAAWAAELLPATAIEARTACLLALGDVEGAARHAGRLTAGTEATLLNAAIAAHRQEWRLTRQTLNELFLSQGLSQPLVDEERLLSLSAFGRADTAPKIGAGPLVSIVVAVRDGEQTLDIALRSLRAQSWSRMEVIVVDDGSSDRSLAIAAAHAQADARVRVLTNTRSPGAYGARNTGILAAQGEIIAFHDADDWAHPERIHRQVQALEKSEGSLCRYFRLDDAGRIVNPRVYPLLRTNPIHLMVWKSTLIRIGLFTEGVVGGDSELLARLETIVGKWRISRTKLCLVVAGWSATSLMGATATGLSREGVLKRTDYVEDWRRRHAALTHAGAAWPRWPRNLSLTVKSGIKTR